MVAYVVIPILRFFSTFLACIVLLLSFRIGWMIYLSQNEGTTSRMAPLKMVKIFLILKIFFIVDKQIHESDIFQLDCVQFSDIANDE